MGNYIGRDVPYGQFDTQTLTPNGVLTTFNLTYKISTASSILVVLSGAILQPNVQYSVSSGGTQIVFATAPTNGSTLYIIYLGRELGTAPVSGVNTGDQNVFSNVSVNGTTILAADNTTDTLTLLAGTGVTLTPNQATDTVTIAASALSDGDRGDITVSTTTTPGDTWTVDNQAITYSKLQNVAAVKLLGNATGSAATAQEISLGSNLFFSGSTLNFLSTFADGSAASPSIFFSNSTNTGIFKPNGIAGLAISIAGAEKFRINNAGYVGIGTSSPDVALSIEGLTQAVSSISSTRYFNDQYSSEFSFKKSRSGTVGANAAVSLNDTLGMISFKGADGTTYANSARILATVTDTITSGIIPGSLAFQTANASGTLTTRLTLDHLGNIIGAGQFEGITGSASSPSFSFSVDTNTGMFRPAEDNIGFATNGTERMTIKAGGQIRFTPLTADPTLNVQAGDVYYNSTTNKLRVYTGTVWVDLH